MAEACGGDSRSGGGEEDERGARRLNGNRGWGADAGSSGPKASRRQTWDAFFDAPKPADSAVAGPGEGEAHELWGERRGDARYGPGPDGKIDDERISHLLGRVLRYHVETVGLTADKEGFVSVSDLLCNVPELQKTTEEDVRRVVQESISSRGPRFEILEGAPEDAEEGMKIRATYKHPKDLGQRRFGGERRGVRGGARSFGGCGRDSVPPHGANGSATASGRTKPGFSRPPPPEGEEEEETSDEDEEDSLRVPARAASAATTSAARGSHSQEVVRSDERDAGAEAETSWERYLEPGTQRPWFWNSATDEVFFADDASSGWERFEDANGQPWWWHEATGRFFFEVEDEGDLGE